MKFIGGDPMKPATKRLAGALYMLAAAASDALFEQRHAMSKRHRLDLVVRHIQSREPELMLHMFVLGAHIAAQFGVEIGWGSSIRNAAGRRIIARASATR
jgi:hypothetical protein